MGAAIAVIGAIGSLAQAGIGIHQANKAKKAQDAAMLAAQNSPKVSNQLESMRISNDAYAAQEAQNAQTQANLVSALSEQGTTASLAGIPIVQQQAEIASANIAAQKSQEMQQIEMAKRMSGQKIDDEYLNYQRQLQLMELQGAGAARAQGNQMMWAGLGGLTNLGATYLNGQNGTMGKNGKLDPPDYSKRWGYGIGPNGE